MEGSEAASMDENSNTAQTPTSHHMTVETTEAHGRSENYGPVPGTKTRMVKNPTIVHYRGEEHAGIKRVNQPTQFVASIAKFRTEYWWLNWGWLVFYLFFLPAAFGVLWFGLIPIGRQEDSSRFKRIAVWAFVINPGTYVFFSFMMTNVFLACLDVNRPWRPFKHYAPILLVNYILQVGVIGTIAMLWRPFAALGLVAIIVSILTTLVGLRVLPHSNFDCDKDRFERFFQQFKKIMITFVFFWIVLLAYIIANGQSTSAFQGLFTALLSFITFIFKKVLLALTDTYPIEIAMVISGFWLENLVDVFIALAYPTATELAYTFATIWLTRVAEDVSFLAFQLDAWFRFRVWIKGVLTGKKGVMIEEDLDLNDRGHSNQHPGYRRRQMRFLIWKLASRMSSTIFYLAVIPVLRFGWNREFYPYSHDGILRIHIVDEDTLDLEFTDSAFTASMSFAIISLATFFVPWSIIFYWMKKYHGDILGCVNASHAKAFVSEAYFGFVLAMLIGNVLLGVSSVQVYNRLYFF